MTEIDSTSMYVCMYLFVPGQLVISDMWCEGSGGIWKGDDDFSFFDAPFIWGVLHNFGGNVGMWGDVGR